MRALVLDRTHTILLDGDRLPDIAHDGSARPLQPVTAWFAARGLTLPAPAGSRPCPDGGRDFVFVIDPVAPPAGLTWRPLREVSADDALWDLYVERVLGGWAPPTRAIDVWSFGDRPEMAANLAHLVVCGDKRVTMGWIAAAAFDGTPLPILGGVSVVTDAFGYPRLVLRTVTVDHVRFDAIDAATVAGEGEGDLSYHDWREGHLAYFGRQATTYGLTFGPDALIAIERFDILHVVGRTEAPAG